MIASLRCSQRLALPKADDDEEQDLNLPDLFFQVATKSVAGGAARRAPAPLPEALSETLSAASALLSSLGAP